VSFHKLKLTNNISDKHGFVSDNVNYPNRFYALYYSIQYNTVWANNK